MERNCRRSKSICRYYKPLEGSWEYSEKAGSCGSCVYFSSKNCKKHSADEIPDFFEIY